MYAAAAFLFAIQCLNRDYVRADTGIQREPPFALVHVARPAVGGLQRHRHGEVVVRAGTFVEDGVRLLRLYANRGEEWWELRESGGPPEIEDPVLEPAEPVEVGVEKGLLAVTYRGHWRGANTYGETAKTLLLDFDAEPPRVRLLVECGHGNGGGACTAPDSYRYPRKQLTCDASLRCTSTETQWIDWTTRTATRTFDLLTDETFPPERLAAVTYPSGAAYAEAFAADRGILGQRAVIERVGPVTPVFELSKDSVLFAGPTKDARVAVRFFQLTPGNWRELAVVRLTDGGYPDDRTAPPSLADDHTPDAPPLLFFAWNLEHAGKGRLIEVVAREGEARSLYWVMFDPNGRAEAIRLATDTAEFRHCDDRLLPPSFTSVGIPMSGLPALVTAIHSWRLNDCEEKTLARSCGLVGRLAWSSSKGWQRTLFEAPCSNPWPQPYVPTLDDDGTLGVDFARQGGECGR